jgi:hypothetical protein
MGIGRPQGGAGRPPSSGQGCIGCRSPEKNRGNERFPVIQGRRIFFIEMMDELYTPPGGYQRAALAMWDGSSRQSSTCRLGLTIPTGFYPESPDP